MEVAKELRNQSGVQMLEMFRSGNKRIAVHGYKDEATYQSLVSDPNGPFARAQAKHNVEEYGRWLYSERGETVPIA
jgi:hypothetical protein